jgi:hypothetical protein
MEANERASDWMKIRFGPGTVICLNFWTSMAYTDNVNSGRGVWEPIPEIKEWLGQRFLATNFGYSEDNEAFFHFPETNHGDALLFKMTFS